PPHAQPHTLSLHDALPISLEGIVALFALFLVLALTVGFAQAGEVGAAPRAQKVVLLRSSAVLVQDADTGEVVINKNSEAVVPIASITKLMTAMVLLDSGVDLSMRVVLAREDVDRYKGSRSRLRTGSVLTRDELLLLALMASENRAGAALGRTYPGGTQAIVEAMNEKAAELEMTDSHFVDATGLSKRNVSSARDLAKLVRAAHGYPLIREYSTRDRATVTAFGRPLSFRNTNGLVRSSHWEIGLSKTGYISEAGRRLFERICRLREYYLTRAELALTRAHIAAIAHFTGTGGTLIEYGSGESVKSRLLLRAMRPSRYVPVDISEDALQAAAARLAREFPRLDIVPVMGDFSRPLPLPVKGRRGSCAVYFPGSTIGNLTPEEAQAFLAMTRGQARRMLVGVDLKKDASVLYAAYNDAKGVTAAFNLNLLRRINRELGGDFDLRGFAHYAFYNPGPGRIEMHLVSLARQTVSVGEHRFAFDAGESIHTENSYKYSIDEFQALAAQAGLRGA